MKNRKRVSKFKQLKKSVNLNMSEIKEQSIEISNDDIEIT
jgi:hypothetical protein